MKLLIAAAAVLLTAAAAAAAVLGRDARRPADPADDVFHHYRPYPAR